jgi:hypothetical protein
MPDKQESFIEEELRERMRAVRSVFSDLALREPVGEILPPLES